MGKKHSVMKRISINLIILIVPICLFYLDLREDLRSGSLPSNGDNIMIPFVGFTFLWAVILLTINIVIAIVRRKRSS